jgi:anti-sigma regulatory factor (Ser/Thr protein kinase)
VAALTGAVAGGQALIDRLLKELSEFTGAGWEQEDDITLVTLECRSVRLAATGNPRRLLTEFEVTSEPGNERVAIDRVAAAVGDLDLNGPQRERLATAVGEATMNAIEHGNNNRPELPVGIRVLADDADLRVLITDQGGGQEPLPEVEVPDLDAKLAGLQTPRGWGLFLIKNMVDELHTSNDERHHVIELVMHLNREPGSESAGAGGPGNNEEGPDARR